MELKKITEQVYYISNSLNFGVVIGGEGSAILIDTGFDDDAGGKILNVLEEAGLSVKAIINTHSHADHCGGNRYIKETTSATIYAPELESAIIEYPLLEPLSFFSGAHPIKDLQHKFYMATPSDVDYVIKNDEKEIIIGKIDLGIVPLPGHAANQIGIAVDDILFCADSVFHEKILENCKIPFIMDVDGAKETLKFLRETKYKCYVPSHLEPSGSLTKTADANLEVVESIEKFILESCGERKTTEQVLGELCGHYRINLKGTQHYYLTNTVVMAFLGSLCNRGKLKTEVVNNSLFWERI